MKQVLHSDWLPDSLAPNFPRWSRFSPYNISFIFQACSVKMDECWSRIFSTSSPRALFLGTRLFFCVWFDWPRQKELRNIQPSWYHVWLIKHIHYLTQGKRTYFGEQIMHVHACKCWHFHEGDIIPLGKTLSILQKNNKRRQILLPNRSTEVALRSFFGTKKCRAKFGVCLKQNRLSGGEMRGASVSGLTLSFPWNESVATVHGDMHSRPWEKCDAVLL